MIVSKGRRYVFIHIPKTGGTALALALESRAMRDDIMLGDTPKAIKRRRRLRDATSRGRLWKHSTLADIEGLVDPDELDQLFAFTLVRNPWDRAVSYYHWLRAQRFDHSAVKLARQLTFPDFVAHPRIMDSFRAYSAGRYMRRSDGREQCDAYLRLEQFEEDAAPLVAHLGFGLSLPRANHSDRARDYRLYYTDTSAAAIADCCAEDIARFGYGFG
ncbi:sulfotransferase family 2 domain-containing protein [Microbulbifer sp. S227A]|uniref:sulfotransferase family 2 domain-containing protein n=1 Tax=Microbulbifer sp. S227A TaxID=3415131 RepID=UPI003C7C6881